MHLSCIFILLLFLEAQADNCQSNSANLPEVRLKKDLLCGYDTTRRPVTNHKTAVPVFMRMILKYFVFEIHDSTFDIDNWMVLMWKDEHLTWDPAKYDSIDQIHLSDSQIWMPDISIFNRRYQGGVPHAIDNANCVVTKNGQVICVPSTHESSLCVPDLTKYPFDTQNCTIRFGSWIHSGEELDIKLLNPAVTTEDLVSNGEWELIDHQVIKHPGKFKCCPNNTYPSINFSFSFRRLVAGHVASIILPALALIVLTLVSLWPEPDQLERFYLCCVNVICEILYLQYVSWSIPLHGDRTPLILLFARDSLLLSTFTVVFTLVLKNMITKDKPAPAWLSGTVSVLIATKPGQFVFLNDTSVKEIATAKGDEDGATIIQNLNSVPREWVTFAKILDRICFFIYLILYFVMIISFTP